MSIDQVRRTMDGYFNAMGRGEDFSTFYTAEVTWFMMDNGQQVHGPSAVRDYVSALHGRMFGHRQRQLVVADGRPYLEGECVDRPEAAPPGQPRSPGAGGR